jgi:hypothetical protein
MAREFSLLPSGRGRGHFQPQRIDALVKLHQLAVSGLVLTGGSFQFRDLPLNLFEFLLRISAQCHSL